MSALLIRGALRLVCMDAARRELPDAWLLIEDGVVAAIGQGPAPAAARTLDASGCVVTPALVNTHHHLFQTLTRAVPAAQHATLFGWLRALYPIWGRMRPEDVTLAAAVGLAELALSGCGTCADHHYLFPDGVRLEDVIEAAGMIGLRLHAARGAMSLGESAGGLPPDALVERERDILKDFERVVAAFHDPAPGAMTRVALAPCSPFSVSEGLMRDAAILAREKGVRLHTHLAENAQDVAFSLERFGLRPGPWAESLGWTGEDVWHAHCVRLDADEIALFARTGTAVAHCPCSNCRLGAGIAPVRAMLAAGVTVGLGVDGSASNDAGALLAEARQAMLLQRAAGGPDALSARAALEMATLGGARALGRAAELGALAPGMRADVAVWDMSGLECAGAWDPTAALALCPPRRVRDLIVEGREVVRDGRLTRVDERALSERAAAAARRLAQG
ncbi:8-oxoguanine deaminase [Oceanicella actignis]|uniref:8-oxoguanine deaminase n=1 Tax=Oceanicella actignis TaxID=1189325 RepID=UPI0011E74191|nr:8-oxoguanine deaminase [Oceanicella actignis]TYO84652.1 cytosine/adenosine deaminase-related metal-dependent hydrolase [Oceanicella actignis]